MRHSGMPSVEPQSSTPLLPNVLSFDPEKVMFAGDYVYKRTGIEEYWNLRTATEFLTERPMALPDGTKIEVASVVGFTPGTTAEDSGQLTLHFCNGVNLETLVREQYPIMHTGCDVPALFANFVRTAIANGLGWQDMAPRNMLLEPGTDTPGTLTLLDFEKPSRFGNVTPAQWARILHGYVREELSCLFPLAVVDEILWPYDNEIHEPLYLGKDEIRSSRKLALLASILDEDDFASDTLPTKLVRQVEHAMAVAAQPTIVDGKLHVTMDAIEEQVRRNGLSWYVDYVHSKNPDLAKTVLQLNNTASSPDRMSDAVTHASPTGYNTITKWRDESRGMSYYHLGKPAVTVKVPIGPNVYTPAKTAADIAALLANHYGDSLEGLDGLELGCGDHAVLAHTLRALGIKKTIATDIDPKAVSLVKTYGDPAIESRQSNIFSALRPDERMDIILFNAPQMPMPSDERAALTDWHDSPGDRGYEVILDTIAKAPGHLKEGGKLVMMIFDFLMSDGVVAERARQHGFKLQTIGKLVKPVRKGGQTEKALEYIRGQFPNLEVHESDQHGQHITGSLVEFTLDS